MNFVYILIDEITLYIQGISSTWGELILTESGNVDVATTHSFVWCNFLSKFQCQHLFG